MSKDQLIGGVIFAACTIGIFVYGWILFFTGWSLFLLQLTAFIAVAGVLGILAWIGYTLATTPPPASIEELEKEPSKEEAGSEKKEEKEKEQ
ncbi:MAG: hypothetical protein QXU44_12000 [Candidatus Caldarchaeum sp.]